MHPKRSMTPTQIPTMPPGPADDAALDYARKLAAEQDTGPVAAPGSVRLVELGRRVSGEYRMVRP